MEYKHVDFLAVGQLGFKTFSAQRPPFGNDCIHDAPILEAPPQAYPSLVPKYECFNPFPIDA